MFFPALMKVLVSEGPTFWPELKSEVSASLGIAVNQIRQHKRIVVKNINMNFYMSCADEMLTANGGSFQSIKHSGSQKSFRASH